jgi:hypothetical protein
MRRPIVPAIIALGGMLFASEARADYSEAVNGNFSSNNLAPTVVAVSPGRNHISGTAGNGDFDYFQITVPAGSQLTSIFLDGYSTTETGDLGFFGLAAGTTISNSQSTAAGLLGWVHIGATLVGTDLLPGMGTAGFGSSGFTPPLGPGNYSFRVQDDDPVTMQYQFDIVLTGTSTPTPALPTGYTVAIAGFLLVAGARMMRRSQVGAVMAAVTSSDGVSLATHHSW